MKKMVLIGLVLAFAATACGDSVDGAAATTSAVEADAPDATENGGAETSVPSEDKAPGSGSDESGVTDPSRTTIPEERTVEDEDLPERATSDTPVTGEADPSLVASIKQDLIDRTGATESAITVVRSEEVIWNDGSLGCPEPGEMYTQALVNGFWVVLEHDGTQYDYRANEKGFFRLCEGFGAPPTASRVISAVSSVNNLFDS